MSMTFAMLRVGLLYLSHRFFSEFCCHKTKGILANSTPLAEVIGRIFFREDVMPLFWACTSLLMASWCRSLSHDSYCGNMGSRRLRRLNSPPSSEFTFLWSIFQLWMALQIAFPMIAKRNPPYFTGLVQGHVLSEALHKWPVHQSR